MTIQDEIAYRFELCRQDGTTPIGEPVVVEVNTTDYRAATTLALAEHPGHEVVSWGRVDEIEAYAARPR